MEPRMKSVVREFDREVKMKISNVFESVRHYVVAFLFANRGIHVPPAILRDGKVELKFRVPVDGIATAFFGVGEIVHEQHEFYAQSAGNEMSCVFEPWEGLKSADQAFVRVEIKDLSDIKVLITAERHVRIIPA